MFPRALIINSKLGTSLLFKITISVYTEIFSRRDIKKLGFSLDVIRRITFVKLERLREDVIRSHISGNSYISKIVSPTNSSYKNLILMGVRMFFLYSRPIFRRRTCFLLLFFFSISGVGVTGSFDFHLISLRLFLFELKCLKRKFAGLVSLLLAGRFLGQLELETRNRMIYF